ncbi:hypothetical protein CYJ99_03970 [Neisseria perflava]|jgi:hypothetical protein|nr:hypothetical protein CYJ99_03970 [Neisseria perflava]
MKGKIKMKNQMDTNMMIASTATNFGLQMLNNSRINKQEKNALAREKMNRQMDALQEVFSCCERVAVEFINCLNTAEQEKTKREMIANWKEVSLEKIAAQKQFLMQYLDNTFEERKENFSHFFNALDKGIESGNIEIVNAALNGIVDLAKTSPLKAEVSQVLAALDNEHNMTEFKF